MRFIASGLWRGSNHENDEDAVSELQLPIQQAGPPHTYVQHDMQRRLP